MLLHVARNRSVEVKEEKPFSPSPQVVQKVKVNSRTLGNIHVIKKKHSEAVPISIEVIGNMDPPSDSSRNNNIKWSEKSARGKARLSESMSKKGSDLFMHNVKASPKMSLFKQKNN
jgi:hypothetical protein